MFRVNVVQKLQLLNENKVSTFFQMFKRSQVHCAFINIQQIYIPVIIYERLVHIDHLITGFQTFIFILLVEYIEPSRSLRTIEIT